MLRFKSCFHLLRVPTGTIRYNSTSSNELLNDILNKSKRVGSTVTQRQPISNFTSRDNNNNNNNNNNNSSKRTRGKKRLMITWTTGSQRAQDAANSVIREILRLNHSGTIKAIDTESNKMHTTNIREFARGINLDTTGLSIVNVESSSGISNETLIPLVKLVDSKVALRRYSDELARLKEEELIAKGLMTRKRSSSGNSNNNNGTSGNGDGGLKHIKVSWQIEIDDLVRQKIKEVLTLLKKGHKVNIYINDRNKISSANWLDTFEDLEQGANHATTTTQIHLPKREIRKREDIVREIRMVLEEYTSKMTIEGNIRSKMMVKLVPKPQNVTATSPDTNGNGTTPKGVTELDERALKEERRRQRQVKLQQRTERKRQQQQQQQQVQEQQAQELA